MARPKRSIRSALLPTLSLVVLVFAWSAVGKTRYTGSRAAPVPHMLESESPPSAPASTDGETKDRPPMVTAPHEVSVEKGQLVEIKVTTADPDGDPIRSLSVDLSGLPEAHHAKFKTNASHTVGTLRWTPTFRDPRISPYVVRFTATNVLTGSATTSIVVEDLF